MPGRIVDLEGLKEPAVEALRRMAPPSGMPFNLAKLGQPANRRDPQVVHSPTISRPA